MVSFFFFFKRIFLYDLCLFVIYLQQIHCNVLRGNNFGYYHSITIITIYDGQTSFRLLNFTSPVINFLNNENTLNCWACIFFSNVLQHWFSFFFVSFQSQIGLNLKKYGHTKKKTKQTSIFLIVKRQNALFFTS